MWIRWKNDGSDWRRFARAGRNERRNPKVHRKKSATLCEKKKPIELFATPMRQYLLLWVFSKPLRLFLLLVSSSFWVLYKYVETCDSSCILKEHGAWAKKGRRAAFSFRTVLSVRENLRADGGKTFLEGFGCSLRLCLSDRRTDGPHCGHYRRRDSEKVVRLGARGVLRCGFLWISLFLYP